MLRGQKNVRRLLCGLSWCTSRANLWILLGFSRWNRERWFVLIAKVRAGLCEKLENAEVFLDIGMRGIGLVGCWGLWRLRNFCWVYPLGRLIELTLMVCTRQIRDTSRFSIVKGCIKFPISTARWKDFILKISFIRGRNFLWLGEISALNFVGQQATPWRSPVYADLE